MANVTQARPSTGSPEVARSGSDPSHINHFSSVSLPIGTQVGPTKKLRRRGSRLMSALRSLTNHAPGSQHKAPATWPTTSHISETVLPHKLDGKPELPTSLEKLSIYPNQTHDGVSETVVHRKGNRMRPFLYSMEKKANEPLSACSPGKMRTPSISGDHGASSTVSTTAHSQDRRSPAPANDDSTPPTSLDSKLSSKDSERRSATIFQHKDPENRASLDSNLTTIRETSTDLLLPTVVTVEKAAAAKIYLETYYYERLHKPCPRKLRKQYLEAELYHTPGICESEKRARRQMFYRQETAHLRETRALMAQSIRATRTPQVHDDISHKFEPIKVLGKGSFGVVKLVREREKPERNSGRRQSGRANVYAMKVIRKTDMLRSSQEGHLRAERDFLVASEGSRWIVPLIASFQDVCNLYLMMEYMPGGDFLGLLIRENILPEPVARFYIAEMILCIEEAHALRCIHRDIKPDNFLISASGHLVISDFGLAFDGHWTHDMSYYHVHRYSLLQQLGIKVEGDALDRAEGDEGATRRTQNVTMAMQRHLRDTPGETSSSNEGVLDWRNRCGNRATAKSCVGTSQYMAPEVIREGEYDARCDWWSLGIIMFECLFGHTPFLSDEGGRQATKRNIVNHNHTFVFPTRPPLSTPCLDLMVALIQDRATRLSSGRYQYRDTHAELDPYTSSLLHVVRNSHGANRDWTGRAVYPYDGEDIKAHKWFRGIPWDHLHLTQPPFVPQIKNIEDTHYFDESEPISDWSSESEVDEASRSSANDDRVPHADKDGQATQVTAGSLATSKLTRPDHHTVEAGMHERLLGFPPHLRSMMKALVATPYDNTRLKCIDREIDALTKGAFDAVAESERMKAFVRQFGRKESKRPRDVLLRDRNTRSQVLEIRKQTAFLGYTFRSRRTRRCTRGLGLGLGGMYATFAAGSRNQPAMLDGAGTYPIAGAAYGDGGGGGGHGHGHEYRRADSV